MTNLEPEELKELVNAFMNFLFRTPLTVVYEALHSTETTADFIRLIWSENQLCDGFASEMQSNPDFDRVFHSMRDKISPNFFPPEYRQFINSYSKTLLDIFQNLQQKEIHQLESTAKIRIEYHKNVIPVKDLSTKNFFESPKLNEKLNEKNSNSQANSGIQSNKMIQERRFVDKEKIYQNFFEDSFRSVKKILKTTDVVIEVRYLEGFVDPQRYNYNNFSIKTTLATFVRKFLSENFIPVSRETSEIQIMEEVEFLKSQAAGNYRFDPFHDVLQVWIKTNNDSNFTENFRLQEEMDQLNINYREMGADEWNRKKFSLNPRSSIEELVRYLRESLQTPQKMYGYMVQRLKEIGKANFIDHLFNWQRSDYTKLDIPPTYISQINEIVEQIKDRSKPESEKSLDLELRQCLKTSNSHKILRYLVYKAEGKKALKKIAFINMRNLKKAIKIVKKIIYNDQLLKNMENYFNQFALDPNEHPLMTSRGMILYGPPGTGKTVLAETLPNIMGFHLIEKGLSAADFSKPLVGKTSQMIRDLVYRASISPYLLCSIGLDEVDGLVPDRKDQKEKNKSEGVSMLLSVIGGNKDVPNLVYMTSTNYIKKIDEAIRRRLNGRFQAGRPDPSERALIMIKQFDYLQRRRDLLDHAIRITTNFTGAAMNRFKVELQKILKLKQQNKEEKQLSFQEVGESAILVARQFSINLGAQTLPEILLNKQPQKSWFSQNFFENIFTNVIGVEHTKEEEYKILYATGIYKHYNGYAVPSFEMKTSKVSIHKSSKNPFQNFINEIRSLSEEKNYNFKYFDSQKVKQYQQYQNEIINFFDSKSPDEKVFVIIRDHPQSPGNILYDLLKHIKRENFYLIYYASHGSINSDKASIQLVMEVFLKDGEVYMNSEDQVHSKNLYSGRIMVEVNEEPFMTYELKNCRKNQSKVAFKYFLKSEENTSINTVIPELVDFFIKKQARYLLLIDKALMLDNEAYDEKKTIEVMEEKMFQARGYNKSAAIIDVDSLILLNENTSNSSFGETKSYSIQNHQVWTVLLHYMKTFHCTVKGKNRWLTIVAEHPELIRMIKKNINWPLYPEEVDKLQEQKKLDEDRICVRCNTHYTERKNKEDRKCMQHHGGVIDVRIPQLILVDQERLEKMQIERYQIKRQKNNKTEEEPFIYACCRKGITEPGHTSYYHIIKQQFHTKEDQLYQDQENKDNKKKWQRILNHFKQIKIKAEPFKL